ncbi:hypothetical protein GCM10010103_66690 [Streptomyces paradoxus]|uniref:Uncharacterized protein n=1 Tax=Streptomyces paradoxus TaxID=66375 RepID=A0A7W9WLY6_9ACTN|nr:DUF6445 family protein [Streptomyces paradoxus]MBB6081844.1 hypothetical protein [Streptomyces paradoxus]
MKHCFLVVDDFYDDPDAVREGALRLAYVRPEGVNYPGVAAEGPADVSATMARFSKLLGGIDLKYQRSQGAFRITTADDMVLRTSMVHVDTPDFSAIVHLSKAETEGTYFYRHRELGIERVSPEDNVRPEVRRAIERDTLDPNAWDIVYNVPMKYNRLLIFDGKYFHSGARRFTGANLADGRMTQNFFFYRAQTDSQ